MAYSSYGRITHLVTRMFAVPAAAIAMVEGDRLRVIAREGCSLEEIPRCGSLPGPTLDAGVPIVVADAAALDPPPPVPMLGGLPLRFYAGVPIRDPDGGFVGTLCAGDVVPRDLTAQDLRLLESFAALIGDQLLLERESDEHRKLAAALRASEQRLRDFAEIGADWFWEMNAQLRFTWLSDNVRTLYGVEPAWHYGKSRFDLAATPESREVAQRIEEIMLRREPFRDFDYCRRSPAGDHWLRISGKPIFDEHGGFLGYRGTGRDITELERQRAALQEAEERYRTLIELLPDAVFIKDVEHRILFANRAAATVFGLDDPQALVGQRSFDFIAEEDRAIAEARSRLLLERGGVCPPVELRLRCPDGRERVVEAVATRIDERGEPRVLVVNRDITERKRAERALEEAERRYRALVELSPDPVVLVEEGRFVFANRPAAELFGVEAPASLEGRSLYEFLAENQHEVVRRRHATPLREGETLPPIELEIVRADGTRVEIEAKGSLVLDHGRRLFLGVLRDIGARKAAERALREAERRYRTLVELSPDPVVLVEEGRFVFANRPAAELFGVATPAALEGCSFYDFLPLELREVARRRHATPLREGETLPPIELEIVREDGTRVEIEAKGSRVVHQGRPMLLGVLRDIGARKAAERALREAEERYRTLVELAPVGILVVRDGRYAFANRAAATILGASDPSLLVGVDPFPLITEPYRPLIRKRAQRLLATGGTTQPVEIAMHRLDGRTVTIETMGAAISDRGEPAIQIVITDVSERKAAQRALEEAEARWRSLVELSPEAVLLIREGRYVFANQRAAELYGASDPRELVGRAPADFFLEEFLPLIAERRDRLLREGGRVPPLEVKLRRLDGQVIDVETSGTFVLDGGRPAVLTVLRDVTERKAIEAELRRLAHHDPLTGLPNRALFFDRLGQALHQGEREGRCGALLLLDLDGFKQVNDSVGHDAGDALLRGVARRLQRVTRRSDTVARLAGDEFAVLLYPIRDAATVERVAERIRAALAVPIRHRGRPIRARASLGAAIFPGDGTTLDTMFKHADLALYRAKAEGKSGLAVADQAMRLAFAQRMRLGEELREAVQGDAIEVAFEPRCTLDGGRPAALEVVPVWAHPEAGPIRGPDLFDLATECGIAAGFARRLLARTLETCRALDCTGLPPLPIAIDLPTGTALTDGGAAQIVSALQERGFPASRLVLELTESIFHDRDRAGVRETLARLREAGVMLVLDRFGSGPCDLRPLLDRMVDGVNVEPAGLVDSDLAPELEALVASVTSLATRLGQAVTAVGVRSDEQRRFFASLGCQFGQGPFWSRPLSVEALRHWLAARSNASCSCSLPSGTDGRPYDPTGLPPDP